MAAATEFLHVNFDLELFSLTYETDLKLMMAQLNSLNDNDHSRLLFREENDTKNISDTFVEKYESELRCQQNPANKWMTSHPVYWKSSEVIDWLYSFAELNGIDCSRFKAEAFQDKTGQDLCIMNQRQFQELDPNYGKQIYDTFQEIHHSCSDARLLPLLNDPVITSTHNSYMDLSNAASFTNSIPVLASPNPNDHSTLPYNNQTKTPDVKLINPIYTNNSYVHKIEPRTLKEEYDSTGEKSPQYCPPPHTIASTVNVYSSPTSTEYTYNTNANNTIPPQNILNQTDKSCTSIPNSTVVSEQTKKRRQTRGRRSGHGSKGTHLWEFIRDLLHDDNFCPSLIKWEDPNIGVFRFVQSEAVAKMWGRKKNNSSMSYEKLSRAMRYYYKRGILVRVDGRRLVYRFGPRSYGWRKM